MNKQTRRKHLSQASRKSQLDIRFQEDSINRIKERERTSGIKTAARRYYLPVVGR